MGIGRRMLTMITMAVSVVSVSFGDAIVAGFDTTSDGRNNSGTYTTGGCNNPFPGGTCAGTPVPIGFNVDFYGTTFNSLYINTDGSVSFDAPVPFVQGLLEDGYFDGDGFLDAYDEIIAPFFADVDTRNPASGVVTFGSGTFDGYDAFGVNWPNVGYFDDEADKLDSFQLILVDRPDLGAGDFEIVFDYGSMQWETGDADFGTDGLGGFSAIVGFTDGTGNPANTFELPGSSMPGSFIDGGPDALSSNSLNSTIPGQYIFYGIDGTISTTPPVVTPEPGTAVLLVTAVLFLFLFRRRWSRLPPVALLSGCPAPGRTPQVQRQRHGF
jgi:hypothetical protein